MHWAEQHRWKRAWEEEVWGRWHEIKGRYTTYWGLMPFKQAKLTFFVFAVSPQDADNAHASFKGIIDGIVKAGIVVDDKWNNVKIASIKFISIKDKKNEHIEILIGSVKYGKPRHRNN